MTRKDVYGAFTLLLRLYVRDLARAERRPLRPFAFFHLLHALDLAFLADVDARLAAQVAAHRARHRPDHLLPLDDAEVAQPPPQSSASSSRRDDGPFAALSRFRLSEMQAERPKFAATALAIVRETHERDNRLDPTARIRNHLHFLLTSPLTPSLSRARDDEAVRDAAGPDRRRPRGDLPPPFASHLSLSLRSTW